MRKLPDRFFTCIHGTIHTAAESLAALNWASSSYVNIPLQEVGTCWILLYRKAKADGTLGQRFKHRGPIFKDGEEDTALPPVTSKEGPAVSLPPHSSSEPLPSVEDSPSSGPALTVFYDSLLVRV